MKYTKSIAAMLFAACALVSCDPSDFGDINDNPNYPTSSYTNMMFKYAATYTRNFIMTSASFDPWPALWSGYLAEAKNNQYGPLTATRDFGSGTYYYYPIKNLTKIIEACENEELSKTTAVTAFGSPANQIGVCTTLRSFFYMTLTDIHGPIVYSEALKGDADENWTPKLDAQKDVYAGLDAELCAAYAKMDESSSLASADDMFFKGDIKKWKKLNASLRMMMAIKLADVDSQTGAARFAKAYADGGMTSVDDSFCWTFDQTNSSWLYYSGNMGYASRTNYFGPNKIFVDALKDYQDPRLFTYCNVGEDAYLGQRAGDPAAFETYRGIPHGLASNNEVADQKNLACSAATKFCEQTASYGLITTARTLLVEAEAAQRGWINANAADLYAAGIQASFDFEAATDKNFDPTQATDYIAAHPLPADNAEALNEIVMQRFLAGFMTDGVEAWSDWRRFNVPTMPVYQGQINENHLSYPSRLAYAANDYTTNNDNVVAALKDLSSANDDPWVRVWWDVADNACPVGTLE